MDMKTASAKNNGGFTLVEMIMVMLVVSVMAAVAIPQFVNFQRDAKNAKSQAFLGVLRSAVVIQQSQMALRCDAVSGTFPPVANFTGNSITAGASPCTTAQVTVAAERAFVPNGIPANPWSSGAGFQTVAASDDIIACVGAGCTPCEATGCAAASQMNGGWCYQVATGKIWPDSANNGLGAGLTECNY